ncbi:hypothetical protein ACI2IY_07405 [Lysobacter enzymogenes]|uniref:hypothetical protein n=1 Tax=Lysobacter enzymogenes TaxID=69 RepID=UPI00385087C5
MPRGFALFLVLAALAPAAVSAAAPVAARPAPTPEQQAVAETDRTALREFETRRIAATHPNGLYRLYGAP